jgi:hypothetical protein
MRPQVDRPYTLDPNANNAKRREPLQGHLAHKKTFPRRTLPQSYAQGPVVILGGWVLLMSEVPL